MDRVLEDALRPIIDGYAKHQKNGRLLAPVPQDQKDLCVRIITARMKVLDQDSADYRECAFLRRALSNGWLVSDIDALSAFYQAVQHAKESDKPEGEFYIQQIASMRMDKLIDRFETLNRVNTYLFDTKFKDSKNVELKNAFTKIHNLQSRPVFSAEYPNDPDFTTFAGTKDIKSGVSYSDRTLQPGWRGGMIRRFCQSKVRFQYPGQFFPADGSVFDPFSLLAGKGEIHHGIAPGFGKAVQHQEISER